MKSISKITYALTITMLTLCVLGTAQASMSTFTVEAGESEVRTINVSAGDTVFINFKMVGGQTYKTLDFWVTFPNSTITDFGQVSEFTTHFETQVKGTCELHFDNSNSTDPMLVTLNYSIDRYYFGLPQWIVLLMVIGVILAFVALGYIFFGKRY